MIAYEHGQRVSIITALYTLVLLQPPFRAVHDELHGTDSHEAPDGIRAHHKTAQRCSASSCASAVDRRIKPVRSGETYCHTYFHSSHARVSEKARVRHIAAAQDTTCESKKTQTDINLYVGGPSLSVSSSLLLSVQQHTSSAPKARTRRTSFDSYLTCPEPSRKVREERTDTTWQDMAEHSHPQLC